MKRDNGTRLKVSCVVVACTLVVLGFSGILHESRTAAAQPGGDLAEIERIFNGLERTCDEAEAVLQSKDVPQLWKVRADVLEAKRLLDFLKKEAAGTLGSNAGLQKRVKKLEKRIEDLLKALSEKGPGAEMKSGSPRAMLAPPSAPMTSPSPLATRPKRVTKRKAASVSVRRRAMEKSIPPFRPPMPQTGDWNREAYQHQDENPFIAVRDDPLSTFSIDVDTASYSNLRRMIMREGRRRIPAGAVRIEEMVNYFKYTYRQPGGEHPLAVDVETTGSPWTPKHRLVRVALQARALDAAERAPSNLVFLVDSSGSMNNPNKIGLLKEAYKLLVDGLDERDRVAIVAYAGSAGLVLPSTTANNRLTLKFAVEQLRAGGSTAGGAGIELAYRTARENFIEGGNNRVILATDGDFNVGLSSQSELVKLIQKEATSGVFLTVLGFGSGNYQDARMEALSNAGNGNYAYIDDIREARKVFLTDLMSTLYTVCKDVKFQIEFNPAYVSSYRLIGYENRQLADRDFKDDRKDAGEVGSGHQVTALYELVPAGVGGEKPVTGDLRYQGGRSVVEKAELMNIKVRYKQPDGETSTEMVHPVHLPGDWATGADFTKASEDTRFAAAVAALGMILRDSQHKGEAELDWVRQAAMQALGQDPGGYRSEFVGLVDKARAIKVATEPGPETPPRPEPLPVPVPQ